MAENETPKDKAAIEAAALQKQIDEMTRLQMEMNGSPQMTIEEVYGPPGPNGEKVMLHKKVTVTPRPASSVSFTMDSKGNIKPDVKIYHEDPAKALEIADDIMTKAIESSHKMVEE
jgi:hypothetical protein